MNFTPNSDEAPERYASVEKNTFDRHRTLVGRDSISGPRRQVGQRAGLKRADGGHDDPLA